MDSEQLQQLAEKSRTMRETGIAIIISSFVLMLFLFVPLSGPKAPEPAVADLGQLPNAFANASGMEAKAVIVYDLTEDKVLYEQNADAQLPLASLTKLLTVYAALSELSPETPITVPAEALVVEYPRAFNEGQTFSLADIARLTLTASLNDGAVAILDAAAERQNTTPAQALAGAAAGLDLAQTYAVNGSGLDVSTVISGGYGSARDLARLAGALVKKAPEIAYATTQLYAEAKSFGGTWFKVKNTDPIATSLPHLLLSKTGFTDLAGGNLALVFDSAVNHLIAVVVLGSTEKARFTDAARLVSDTYAHFAGIASL